MLDVLESRDKQTVIEYLQKNKQKLFSAVEEVTCDMWDAYVNAAEEVFGKTLRVTIDRFHVIKNFQEHLTECVERFSEGSTRKRRRN